VVNIGCMNFVIYFLFTWELLIWLGFFFPKMTNKYGSWFWEFPSSTRIFNGLQDSFQARQGFINVSESFCYKDSLFILATIRTEDLIINSNFKSDFLLYLGLFKGDKSDPIILRILNLDLLLLLLFSL
jgi:hypothetical protein